MKIISRIRISRNWFMKLIFSIKKFQWLIRKMKEFILIIWLLIKNPQILNKKILMRKILFKKRLIFVKKITLILKIILLLKKNWSEIKCIMDMLIRKNSLNLLISKIKQFYRRFMIFINNLISLLKNNLIFYKCILITELQCIFEINKIFLLNKDHWGTPYFLLLLSVWLFIDTLVLWIL